MTNSSPDTTAWATLTAWSLLAVKGPQALSFLQGQVTCDLKALGNSTTLGAHCNPKGRMIFSFRALSDTEENYLLRVPANMQETAKKSLGKYIVFSKAELEPLDHLLLRGLNGPAARQLLTEQLTAPAEQVGQWVKHQGQFILTLGDERFECWLSPDQADRLDQVFNPYAIPEGDSLWRLLDIRAGLGEVQPQTQEVFTPQALNFPQVGAVSFRKGCYTGQEVVARLHYKGKLKRTLHRLQIDCAGHNPTLTPGQTLSDPQGKKLAELIIAAPSEAEKVECLVVMEEQAVESAALEGTTFRAQLLPLPYTVE